MNNGKKLSHINESGNANMVDISNKRVSTRKAKASCKVKLSEVSFKLVKENKAKKGDVLGVARIAGIMGAKKTSDLIPLCHHLSLSKVDVDFIVSENENSILVIAEATTNDRTGVEMEALVAASVASLTVYDMLKAVDKEIMITDMVLDFKDGGRSGTFIKRKT